MHIFFVKFEMYLLWRLQLFYIQNICMTSRPSMVSTKWSIHGPLDACSAPPQISVSKLTLFVLVVSYPSAVVCLLIVTCGVWKLTAELAPQRLDSRPVLRRWIRAKHAQLCANYAQLCPKKETDFKMDEHRLRTGRNGKHLTETLFCDTDLEKKNQSTSDRNGK